MVQVTHFLVAALAVSEATRNFPASRQVAFPVPHRARWLGEIERAALLACITPVGTPTAAEDAWESPFCEILPAASATPDDNAASSSIGIGRRRHPAPGCSVAVCSAATATLGNTQFGNAPVGGVNVSIVAVLSAIAFQFSAPRGNLPQKRIDGWSGRKSFRVEDFRKS